MCSGDIKSVRRSVKMSERKIVFVAKTGILKITYEMLKGSSKYKLTGIIDDDIKLKNTTFKNLQILGTFNELDLLIDKYEFTDMVMCLPEGYNNLRKEYYNIAKKRGINFPNIISEKSSISSEVKMKEGVIIFAGVSINVDCQIGKNVIIWNNT